MELLTELELKRLLQSKNDWKNEALRLRKMRIADLQHFEGENAKLKNTISKMKSSYITLLIRHCKLRRIGWITEAAILTQIIEVLALIWMASEFWRSLC